jgi:thiol-disulfide isomerase/thioredoxin
MRSVCAVVLVVLLAGCAGEPDSYAIHGRITGADGRPLIQSDIQLFSNEPTRPRILFGSFRAGEDGSYSIPVGHAGFYFFRVCGVNHQPVEMPVFLENLKNVQLDIKMKAVEYVQAPESVLLVGDFNNFSHRGGGLEMTRGEDGLYRVTVETTADTLAYQVLGIDANGHSVSGTRSDRLIPDDWGDYKSVIDTRGRTSVTIELDLKQLDYPAGGGAIEFGGESGYQETFAQIFTDVVNRREAMWGAYREHMQKGGGPDDFDYDYANDTDVLSGLWEREEDPVAGEMRMWARVAYGKLDSTLAARVLGRLQPDASLWSVEPQLLTNLVMATGEDSVYLDYLIALEEQHGDDTIKPFVLQHAMWVADNHGLDDLVAGLYQRFASKYADSNRLADVNASYSPDRNIQPGRPVPDFAFTSIDNPSQSVDRSSLMGKVYLIDFWATWCGPCVAEMEYIHAAHEEYAGKGLVVVSVSFDWQMDNLTAFRRDKWPLPWFNAFETHSETNPVVRNFELVSIPKPVLVGSDGIIIASGGDLRGEKLQKTLAKVFGP